MPAFPTHKVSTLSYETQQRKVNPFHTKTDIKVILFHIFFGDKRHKARANDQNTRNNDPLNPVHDSEQAPMCKLRLINHHTVEAVEVSRKTILRKK
ncbi:hypothetical protein EXW96_17370 [Paenibacillus sp. JMULE4]|nr:hypothetical protein [Paenibacillus sp. JMULE4]